MRAFRIFPKLQTFTFVRYPAIRHLYMKHHEALALNKNLWEAWTRVHAGSAFYDLAAFRRHQDSLNATEIAEMGSVEGLSLLHLQCHFGQDTLSWKYRGAAKVAGVDFSERSIALAQQLSEELVLEAEFYRGEVTQADQIAGEAGFDRVFTSYGTVIWLPDLRPWARAIARCLKPGGAFYMIEFHPVLEAMDPGHTDSPPFFQFPYCHPGADGLRCQERGSYADRSADVDLPAVFWPHSIGEVVTALAQAGLQLQFLHEHPFVHYGCFEGLYETAPGYFQLQDYEGQVPLMYSLWAQKPG
jgi:ubiquinone/menaquinone biosynthesis C-methylase UbiE